MSLQSSREGERETLSNLITLNPEQLDHSFRMKLKIQK